ncbi:TPA: hypothetical protein BOS_11380 [Bos taurus]|nr:TPA: hypothetical protein BOS_11380 [Bos taurus]
MALARVPAAGHPLAVSAEQLVLLGSKRLVHEGAPAPRAMETGLVPMPVLIRQGPGYLAVTADQLPALLTGAGEQGLKAGHTVGLLLPKYVLPAEERVLAVVAVKALGHLGPGCLGVHLPGLQELEERRGAGWGWGLYSVPAAPVPPSKPADGRKNGEGRVFVPRGRGREGPVPTLQAGGALFGRSVVPPGQGDPVELEKAPPPLDPRPPSPAWGLSGTACGRERTVARPGPGARGWNWEGYSHFKTERASRAPTKAKVGFVCLMTTSFYVFDLNTCVGRAPFTAVCNVIKAETEEQREEAITHLVLPAASEERHASFLPPVTEAFTKSVCTTILMAAPSARTWAGPPSSGPVEHRLTANGQSARLIPLATSILLRYLGGRETREHEGVSLVEAAAGSRAVEARRWPVEDIHLDQRVLREWTMKVTTVGRDDTFEDLHSVGAMPRRRTLAGPSWEGGMLAAARGSPVGTAGLKVILEADLTPMWTQLLAPLCGPDLMLDRSVVRAAPVCVTVVTTGRPDLQVQKAGLSLWNVGNCQRGRNILVCGLFQSENPVSPRYADKTTFEPECPELIHLRPSHPSENLSAFIIFSLI